jgi:transposase
MAGRKTAVLDVREMVRRMRLGERIRRIARDLGVTRKTVRRFHAFAVAEGLLESTELPEPGVIEARLAAWAPRPEQPTGPDSSCEPYRDLIAAKRKAGVELRALHRILQEQGFEGSYSAVRRFANRMFPPEREAFVRIETSLGEEAQVDFGYAGKLFDPVTKRMRKAWVFVMTLSFSRHQYAEIVFDQKIATWIGLHVRAFEYFGGVPTRIVLDNLKAGIVSAVLYDQEAQRSYRECAEHYGFLIAPCRPRTPRHKGKVESGVHYVMRNALAGRDFKDIAAANAHLLKWITDVAGVRCHGTTQERPLDRFAVEVAALQPLPARRFEIVVWQQAKVRNDCHVVFDYSYYSAPHRLVGEEVWIRATPDRVEIHVDWQRTATHPRATRRGQWVTIKDHLPPEKLAGLLPERAQVKTEARAIGGSALEFVERMLGERPMDRMRGALRVIRLAKRYGNARVEAACRRALLFDDIRATTVEGVLKKGLDLESVEVDANQGPLPKTSVFARTSHDYTTAIAN